VFHQRGSALQVDTTAHFSKFVFVIAVDWNVKLSCLTQLLISSFSIKPGAKKIGVHMSLCVMHDVVTNVSDVNAFDMFKINS